MVKTLDNNALSWGIDDGELILTVKTNTELYKYSVAKPFYTETFPTNEPIETVEPVIVAPVEEDKPNTPEVPEEIEVEVEVETSQEPVEEDEYIIWVKDSLWGKDYEISGDEWTWTRPTEHAYDVYVEGPAGVKVYPQIERRGIIYTTKEDLTSRGPKIGFNRLQAIPMTLKGAGNKVLIGTSLGPGSSSVKGYDGYFVLVDDKSKVIKRIHMRYI